MSRAALTLFGAAVLAACSPTSTAAPSASASASVGPSSPIDEAATCEPIDLVTPSGTRVDLTGTWEGGSMIHHVRQVNDCVWWIGYATWPGLEPGETGTLAFFGRLSDDFTLTGRWALLVGHTAPFLAGPTEHLVTFDLQFGTDGGAQTLDARWEEGGFAPGMGVTYPAETMDRVGPLPSRVLPP